MGVSKNRGTPKSSILIGFSIINHPFWGTIIFGNTQIGYIGVITHLPFPNFLGHPSGNREKALCLLRSAEIQDVPINTKLDSGRAVLQWLGFFHVFRRFSRKLT